MNNLKKYIETGRSMVEMLAALAIMGVLAIGGIMGYKYGMTKYQANQIVNELNLTSAQIAIILTKPHSGAFTVSLDDPYESGIINFGDYPFDFGCETAEGALDRNCSEDAVSFIEEVDEIPDAVCKEVVQVVQNLPHIIGVHVNDESENLVNNCTAENNKITLLFEIENDANGEVDEEKSEPCVKDEDCTSGVCNTAVNECVECLSDNDCLEKCDIETHTCKNCEEINADSHWNGSECITCPTDATWNEETKGCDCSGDSHWNGSECITCPTDATWDDSTKVCVTCVNGTAVVGKYNKHVFCRSTLLMTWSESVAWCVSQGTHLATVYEACNKTTGQSIPVPSSCPNLNKGNGPYVWTSSNASKTTKFYVRLDNGFLGGTSNLTASNNYALCW